MSVTHNIVNTVNQVSRTCGPPEPTATPIEPPNLRLALTAARAPVFLRGELTRSGYL